MSPILFILRNVLQSLDFTRYDREHPCASFADWVGTATYQGRVIVGSLVDQTMTDV